VACIVALVISQRTVLTTALGQHSAPHRAPRTFSIFQMNSLITIRSACARCSGLYDVMQARDVARCHDDRPVNTTCPLTCAFCWLQSAWAASPQWMGQLGPTHIDQSKFDNTALDPADDLSVRAPAENHAALGAAVNSLDVSGIKQQQRGPKLRGTSQQHPRSAQ
jgi:hypothetical protein